MNYSPLKKQINGLIVAFISAGLMSACGGSDESLSRASSSVDGDGGLTPKALNTAPESNGPAGEMSDKKHADLRASEAAQALLADNDDESSDMFSEATDAKLAGLEESGGTKKALIIGGSNATTTPRYVAALVISRGLQDTRRCTGVLVHRQWILTSAHCVELDVELKKGPVSGIAIHLGHNDKNITDAKYKYSVASEDGLLKIVPHYVYGTHLAEESLKTSYRRIDYDIALVKLDRPVPDDVARPIRLAVNAKTKNATKAMVYGYGLTDHEGNRPNILKELEIPEIFDLSGCPEVRDRGNTLQMITCYLVSAQQKTAAGDSGAPIVPINKFSGKPSDYVSAILSGSKDINAFATRVYSHRAWIHQNIGTACDLYASCRMGFHVVKNKSEHYVSSFSVPENRYLLPIFGVSTPRLTEKNSRTQVQIELQQKISDNWVKIDSLPATLVTATGSVFVQKIISPTNSGGTQQRQYRWKAVFTNKTNPDDTLDVAYEYGSQDNVDERRLRGNYLTPTASLSDGVTAAFARGDGNIYYPQLPDRLYDGQVLKAKFQKGAIIRYTKIIVGRTQWKVDLTPESPDDLNVWTKAIVSEDGTDGSFLIRAEFKEGIPICKPDLDNVSSRYKMGAGTLLDGPLLDTLPNSLAKDTIVTVYYTDTDANLYAGKRTFQIGAAAPRSIVSVSKYVSVETWATFENGCYRFHAGLL